MLLTLVGCDRKNNSQQSGNNNGPQEIIKVQKDNSITINVSNKVYDGSPISVSATDLGGSQVSLQYSSNGQNLQSAPKDAGSYTVTASVAATADYKAATQTADFTISQKEVQIQWTSPENLTYNGDAKVPSVAVVASSVVEGDTVTVTSQLTAGQNNVNAGTFTFIATGLSNSNYKLPSEVTSPVYTIGKATPDYVTPSGLTATYGQTLADVVLPQGFSFQDAGTTSVGNVGNNQFMVTYVPSNTDNFASVNDIPVTIAVGKANPTYQTPNNLQATYGDTLADVVLPQGWSWVDPLTTSVGNAGERQFAALFTPADTANYNIVSIDLSINVAKANPSYQPLEPINARYGQTLGEVPLPNGYSFDEDLTTPVGGIGDNNHAVTFTPVDTDNYNVISNLNAVIKVGKGYVEVQPVKLNPVEYRSDLTLDDFPLPERFTYVISNLGQIGATQIGRYNAPIIYTPADSEHYNTMETMAELTIVKGTPTYTVPTIDPVSYGTTLEDISLPFGFTFEDPITTSTGNPGTNKFFVTYSVSDENYKDVKHIEVSITVNKAANTINGVTILDKVYDGQPIDEPVVDVEHQGQVTVQYKLSGADESAYTTERPINVGVYDYKVLLAEGDLYLGDESVGTVEISTATGVISFKESFKRDYEADEAIVITGQYDYNGDSNDIQLSYLPVATYSGGSYHANDINNTFTDGTPTEAGTYYLKISASAGTNVTSCYAITTININDVALPEHEITVNNMSALSAPYNGGYRTPQIYLNGGVSSAYTYTWRRAGSDEWFGGSPKHAGTYEMRIVAPQDALHRTTIKDIAFTIPKGTYTIINPIEFSWIKGSSGSNRQIQYGDTLGAIYNQGDYYSAYGPDEVYDKLYFNDPANTPVGNVGTNKFAATYYPSWVYDSSDHLYYDDYEPLEVQVSVTVVKAYITPPEELTSIVLEAGKRLNDYNSQLPAGWRWNSGNNIVPSAQAGGTYSSMMNYSSTLAGDSNHYDSSYMSVTFNVAKLTRSCQILSKYLDDVTGEITLRNTGAGIDAVSVLSESDIDLDRHDITVTAIAKDRYFGGVVFEYKGINEDDDAYTTVEPTENGRYMLRATLLATQQLDEVVLTAIVNLVEAPLAYQYVDYNEGKTYLFYSSDEENSTGSVYVYNYTGKTVEQLKQLSYSGFSIWQKDPKTSAFLGKDFIFTMGEGLFVADNDDIQPFVVPAPTYRLENLRYDDVAMKFYIDNVYSFIQLEGYKNNNAIVVYYFYSSNIEWGEEYDLTTMEPSFMVTDFAWEQKGDYIGFSSDAAYMGIPYYQADDKGMLDIALGTFVNFGYANGCTYAVRQYGDELYCFYYDTEYDEASVPTLGIYPDGYARCNYFEDEDVFEIYYFDSNGTRYSEFYQIDDSHNWEEYEGKLTSIHIENYDWVDSSGEVQISYLCYYVMPDGSMMHPYIQYSDPSATWEWDNIYYDEQTNTYTLTYGNPVSEEAKYVVDGENVYAIFGEFVHQYVGVYNNGTDPEEKYAIYFYVNDGYTFFIAYVYDENVENQDYTKLPYLFEGQWNYDETEGKYYIYDNNDVYEMKLDENGYIIIERSLASALI